MASRIGSTVKPRTAMPNALLRCIDRRRGRISPESLQLIEVTQRGVKYVNDEIDEVEQDPAALRQPLHMMGFFALGRQSLHDPFSQCPNVRIRRAGGDYEKIRGVSQLAEIQRQYPKGFVLLERVHDKEKFGLFANPLVGHGVGVAAGFRPPLAAGCST